MSVALEAGAEDIVNNDDGSIDIITSPEEFIKTKTALQQAAISIDSAEITMRAATSNKLDLETAQAMITLMDVLDDLDDVQRVYSNADIPEEILSQLN